MIQMLNNDIINSTIIWAQQIECQLWLTLYTQRFTVLLISLVLISADNAIKFF